jgi:hypothetical protein
VVGLVQLFETVILCVVSRVPKYGVIVANRAWSRRSVAGSSLSGIGTDLGCISTTACVSVIPQQVNLKHGGHAICWQC